MNNKEAALDTNILIDYFNNIENAISTLERFFILWIPVPVIAEMEFGYPNLKQAQAGKIRFDTFLNSEGVKIIPCDRPVARHFADIKRILLKKGGIIPVNDIWIAACCIANDKLLITRDSDFRRVPGLRFEMP